MYEKHFDSEYLETMENIFEYVKHKFQKEEKNEEVNYYKAGSLNMDVAEFTRLEKENVFCKSVVSYRGKLKYIKYDCLIDNKILSFIRIMYNYKGIKIKGIVQNDQNVGYLVFDSNTLENEENKELKQSVNKITKYLNKMYDSYMSSKR